MKEQESPATNKYVSTLPKNSQYAALFVHSIRITQSTNSSNTAKEYSFKPLSVAETIQMKLSLTYTIRNQASDYAK